MYTKDTYIIIIRCLIALLLVGCTDTTVVIPNIEFPVPDLSQVINFRFSSENTKATETNGSAIHNFRVWANVGRETDAATIKGSDGFNYIERLNVLRHGDGADCHYMPAVYWPDEEDEPVTFYAYSPAGSVNVGRISSLMTVDNGSADNAEIRYTVPVTPAGLKLPEDFLIASARQSSSENTTVEMNFRHALSMASFAARNTSRNVNYVIDGIELLHLKNAAALDMAEIADKADVYWQSHGGDATYSAGIPSSGIWLKPQGGSAAYIPLTSAAGYIPVLPQSVMANGLTDGSAPALKVSYHTYSKTAAGGKGQYKIFPFPSTHGRGVTRGKPTYPAAGDFVFQMGRSYHFLFDFGQSIQLSVKAVPML